MKHSCDYELIEPGVGVGGLKLFSPKSAVLGLIGEPQKRSSIEEEDWWEYPALGMDVCVLSARSYVVAINVFREGVGSHSGGKAKTLEGLGPASSSAEIRTLLGVPDEEGRPRKDRNGAQCRGWVKYVKKGIAFEFGQDERADLVTVFPGIHS